MCCCSSFGRCFWSFLYFYFLSCAHGVDISLPSAICRSLFYRPPSTRNHIHMTFLPDEHMIPLFDISV